MLRPEVVAAPMQPGSPPCWPNVSESSRKYWTNAVVISPQGSVRFLLVCWGMAIYDIDSFSVVVVDTVHMWLGTCAWCWVECLGSTLPCHECPENALPCTESTCVAVCDVCDVYIPCQCLYAEQRQLDLRYFKTELCCSQIMERYCGQGNGLERGAFLCLRMLFWPKPLWVQAISQTVSMHIVSCSWTTDS